MKDVDLPVPLAKIEGKEIVIRLPLAALPFAASVAFVETGYAANDDAEPSLKITDAKAFAPYLVRALSDESEDGTTPIHKLLDQAICDACEQGAEGVEDVFQKERHANG